MTHANPYAVLGLPTGADADAARTAFRRVAMACHPDRAPGDAHARSRFEEARAAYSRILAARRAMERMEQLRPSFSGLAAPMSTRPPPRVRHPITTTILDLELSPREAVMGAIKRVRGPNGWIMVRVPKGAREGDRLRGGDLLVLTVRLREKTGFHVGENDIFGVVTVSPELANTGGSTIVETPHGKLRVTIPAKFPKGARLRLIGRGLPPRGNCPQGNLYLAVAIEGKAQTTFSRLMDAFGLQGNASSRAAA